MNRHIIYLRKQFTQLFTPMVMLLLVACSGEPRPELSIDSVSIYADPDANQNSAIEVDLVVVYDLELMNTLGKMSAVKYFAISRQLLLDNPTMVDVWHWELVPGQIVDDFTPEQDGDAFGAFVYANYLTDGDHRVKVAPDGVVKIVLQKDDLKNFAVFNATDPKKGTTATDKAKKNGGGCDEACEESFSKMKKGPVKNPSNKCKMNKQAYTMQNPIVCAPIACAPHNRPIPITKRPLAPPPHLKPCPRKQIR